MYDEGIFIEQAEYLEDAKLQNWHIEHPNEKLILRKLCQGGAKLLTGPRGCGKTTLLLHAYDEMVRNKNTFSIYVNFKTSLKIEPLYKKNYNGSYWFKQWLLLKTYKGIFDSVNKYKISANLDLVFDERQIDACLDKIESGLVDEISSELLTISILEYDIKKILEKTNMSLCILLFDDAAHAFSKEQQNDFFEFFRNIKSRMISPKAAIYPGVTDFSAAFHVGHDAEEIDVWIKATENEYLSFMTSLLKKRMSDDDYNQMIKDRYLFEVICYASFGIPRVLLNIVRDLFHENENNDELLLQCNRANVFKAIKKNNAASINIFASLEVKLPIYKEFIAHGIEIFETFKEALKKYNKEKEIDHQAVEFGIRNPLPAELEKVLNFLQYAGLLMYEKDISKGQKGRYSMYVVNYGVLVEGNVFGGSIKFSELAKALKIRDMHEYKRFTVESLLGGRNVNELFPLSLPPCPKCKTPRISPDTKFCSECGEKLTIPSIFEELVNNDIEKLPLTVRRVETIKNNSNIRTIKDILMDTEHRALRNVPGIGPFWAQRIYSYAEEYID